MRYPVSVFEWWLLVWVLLDTTTLNLCSADCTEPSAENGAIRVSTTYPLLTAGYILICDGMEWRAVCHRGWDLVDAMVVCRQLGFDPQASTHCENNCFGRTANFNGFNDVGCIGNETRLIDCPAGRNNNMKCNYAGVICGTMTCPPPDCSTCPQTTPPVCPQATLVTKTHLGQAAQVTAIGGALGALAAGLGLALVGVVTGWVWHCHSNRRWRSNFKEERSKGFPMASPLSHTFPPVAPVYETRNITQPDPSVGTVSKSGGVVTDSNPSHGTVSQSGCVVTDSNPSYGNLSLNSQGYVHFLSPSLPSEATPFPDHNTT